MSIQTCAIHYWLVSSEGQAQEADLFTMHLCNDFPSDVCQRVTTHMNEDHVDAMVDYCDAAGIDLAGETPVMIAIDSQSFLLQTQCQMIKFIFAERCESPADVRQALVDLAQRSRAATKN